MYNSISFNIITFLFSCKFKVATTGSKGKEKEKDGGLSTQIRGTTMIRKLCRVVMNLEQVINSLYYLVGVREDLSSSSFSYIGYSPVLYISIILLFTFRLSSALIDLPFPLLHFLSLPFLPLSRCLPLSFIALNFLPLHSFI